MNIIEVISRLQIFRQLRRLFCIDYGSNRLPKDFTQAAYKISILVRCFYIYYALIFLFPLYLPLATLTTELPYPQWPIVWISALLGDGVIQWIVSSVDPYMLNRIMIIVGLLAVIFPGKFSLRFILFLYGLLAVAFKISAVGGYHGQHFPIYIAFILLFLPSAVSHPEQMSRRDAMSMITIHWMILSVLLLTYTLAGYFKVKGHGAELFTSDGLVRILMNRNIYNLDNIPSFLYWVITYPLLTQIGFVVVVYMQLVSLLIVFRPHLYKLVGFSLILFHIGVLLLMNLNFPNNMYIMAIFMLLAPLGPKQFSLLATLQSLPIIGIPFRLFGRDTKRLADTAWLVYDGECPLCKHYTKYLNVKQAIGNLTLVDARQGGDIVDEVKRIPYDLNNGMVLKLKNRYYYGSDALYILSMLSERKGLFSIINRMVFRSHTVANISYPFLRFGRRVLLWLKRTPLIE